MPSFQRFSARCTRASSNCRCAVRLVSIATDSRKRIGLTGSGAATGGATGSAVQACSPPTTRNSASGKAVSRIIASRGRRSHRGIRVGPCTFRIAAA